MLLVGTLFRFGSIIAWIVHLVACMGGCLGCYTKPELTSAIDDPLKGQRLQHRTLSKPSISEGFWTASTCDMDNSAVQSLSQGSISSISTSNHVIDHRGTSSGNTPSEFVNNGLLLWNQTRQQWVGNKRSDNRVQQLREPKLSTHCPSLVKKFWLCSWNATYDGLLGSNKRFPQAIPLSEMVDFLVDIWEQEGLYD